MPTETILFYNMDDVMTLRGFAASSGEKEMNLEKLRQMQEYADAQVCRRRILLNYFGETRTCDCGNCDVCIAPPKRFDGTELVQKALSAIMRTKEQIRLTLTIDILHGNCTEEVRSRNLQYLKTFGVGRDISCHDWRNYLMQMMQMGLIRRD